MSQHHGEQGTVPWAAPCWDSQWRWAHTYFEAWVCLGGSVPAFGAGGHRDLSWRSRRWHSCCPLLAKIVWRLLTANNIPQSSCNSSSRDNTALLFPFVMWKRNEWNQSLNCDLRNETFVSIHRRLWKGRCRLCRLKNILDIKLFLTPPVRGQIWANEPHRHSFAKTRDLQLQKTNFPYLATPGKSQGERLLIIFTYVIDDLTRTLEFSISW